MNATHTRFALAAFITMAACTDSTITAALPYIDPPLGTPELVTQIRSVPEVGAVTLSDIGYLYVSQGPQTELTVRSERRVLDVLGTAVTDGNLHIGFTRTFQLDHPLTLECFLTVRDLSEIHLEGMWRV